MTKPEKRITLRYNAIDEEAIEQIKTHTGQTTANKAIIQIIHHYPTLARKIIELQNDLDEANKDQRHKNRIILNFTQSLEQLDSLTKTLLNND